MQGKVDIAELGKKFGLEGGLINNLTKSEQTKKNFVQVVEISGLAEGEKKIGTMLYSITTKMPVIIEKYRERLAKEVGCGGITNPNQMDYVLDYLTKNQKKGGVDMNNFVKDCGIGMKVTEDEIRKIAEEEIKDATPNSNIFQYLGKVKNKIPFVEGKITKAIVEQAWKAKGLPEKPVPVEKKNQKAKKVEQEQPAFHIRDINELIGREMNSAVNNKENLQKRNNEFGEGILTRFPPEPNGYLHIGHCKAMRFNFMQAKVSKGRCYLRFDDTNPIKENKEFIENIKENINWMGYEPWKVTHASDNFGHLYNFAVQLIKQGDAFVCSENKEEMKKNRNECLPSKNRDRSVEENLKIFERMRMGLYEQGQYMLRAKIDYKHPNTTLRDPVIYRIRYTSHPHSGNKWCVYPLYDFTHGICDSLQGISHSLCSLQFQIRRQLYYWFLEKLNLYKPSVWEYSRLNITYTVLSKRNLHPLVFNKKVDGWDDPRLLTINGMRRRGYPAEAINNFCDSIGVTRRGNENFIQFGVLQNEVRKYLDIHAPRTMAVIDPVELYIDGIEDSSLQIPLFPKNEQKGKRKISLTKMIYVDRDDIKLKDQKNYYGIAPNKIVGLKYFSSIFIKEVREQNGKITSVHAQVDKQKRKPASFLNWISAEECFDCETRHYDQLFSVEKPNQHPNYVDYLNPNSLKVYKNTKCHKDLLKNVKELERVQFERKGFFVVDKDSEIEKGKIVWNKIVGLMQDKNKK